MASHLRLKPISDAVNERNMVSLASKEVRIRYQHCGFFRTLSAQPSRGFCEKQALEHIESISTANTAHSRAWDTPAFCHRLSRPLYSIAEHGKCGSAALRDRQVYRKSFQGQFLPYTLTATLTATRIDKRLYMPTHQDMRF